ncbi:hypothetical protein R1flu_012873 [Riccia fluitans]|uniref:Ycf15 n=1 Tax=Riccia fluitans TaxID=41844 RepID=A0ABD1ZC63_9MARC
MQQFGPAEPGSRHMVALNRQFREGGGDENNKRDLPFTPGVRDASHLRTTETRTKDNNTKKEIFMFAIDCRLEIMQDLW